MINEQFEKDIEIVPNKYSGFKVVTVNDEKILRGGLEIVNNNGKLWQEYKVEIWASQEYPYRFPKLFEVGNAFLKIADWHVYESDKSCCVDVTPNEIIVCKNGLHVIDYIQQFAIPYLANQKYRELEGYYLYGEYSHGIFGRIEFYQTKLKAKNSNELIQMFDLIIKGFNPNRQAYCPFCYKKKFRKCHRDVFRELAVIKALLYHDGKTQLLPFFKSNPDFQLPNVH